MSRRGPFPPVTSDTDPSATDGPVVCRCGLDLLPLGDLAARLDLSPKTTIRLHRTQGLPLYRLVGAARPGLRILE